MRAAQPVLNVNMGGVNAEIPIEQSSRGFQEMVAVMRHRRPTDPYVSPDAWGQLRIVLAENYEPKPAGRRMDPTNLAYQRYLLGR